MDDESRVNEILDDGRYWNHSDEQNTGFLSGSDPNSTYSLRDINKGEELLDDYGTYYCPAWFKKILDKYNIDESYYTDKPEKKKKLCKKIR